MIEKEIQDTFRPSDSSIDRQGGWYRVHQEFQKVMTRSEVEMDWPVEVEIDIRISEI